MHPDYIYRIRVITGRYRTILTTATYHKDIHAHVRELAAALVESSYPNHNAKWVVIETQISETEWHEIERMEIYG